MLFNMLGRNNPSKNCRVFSDKPKEFYKLDSLDADYVTQHSKAAKNGIMPDNQSLSEIKEALLDIENTIKDSNNYQNLFYGSAIPFCFSMPEPHRDLGTQLEDFWLPLLKKDYESQVEGSYFKATLQGNTELKGSVRVSENSGYDTFLNCFSKSSVAGYYFPTAFQEFDIKSQRSRIADLPDLPDLGVCLSGPFEIVYSLLSYPKLLFSKENYSPILCASALEHTDPRMVMMFKSYGPHLEFWLMTQMLTPTKAQVSEQWSGGITIFREL